MKTKKPLFWSHECGGAEPIEFLFRTVRLFRVEHIESLLEVMKESAVEKRDAERAMLGIMDGVEKPELMVGGRERLFTIAQTQISLMRLWKDLSMKKNRCRG